MPRLTPVVLLLVGAGCSSQATITRGSSSGSSAGSSGSSSGSATGGSTGRSSSTGSGTGSSSGRASSSSGSSGHGAVVTLTLSPNPLTVEVIGGAGSAQIQAAATYADGTSAMVAPSWTFSRTDLGSIDGSGTITSTATQGGDGQVTATLGSATATALVHIVVFATENPAGLTPTQQTTFSSPTTAPSGTLLYPYDQTVFAQGLVAPELMWSGGAAGDAYQVTLSETDYRATLYVTADPPSDWPIPQDVWLTLGSSNQGEPVSLSVQRLSAGVAYAPMTESWTIAPGSLRGSIYYWAVSQGELMKISPGATTPVPMFDPGPADQLGTPAPAAYDGTMPPWTTPSASTTQRCVACHTVSKDGSTAVAIFERQGQATSPWGTIDLSASTPDVVQMSAYTTNAVFLGLSPDGTYAVENDVDFSLHLHDAHAGTALATALEGITGAADPAFSPDGHTLAFASNTVGQYPIEYSQAGLDLMSFDAGGPDFLDRRNLVDGGGLAVAFPSFSPDSAWVFYQYGDYSRAKYGVSSVGHDDLYACDVAGQVGPTLLATASGANLEARNQHLSYQPTVNPISVGGYTWVVFVSPRDYGNKMLSTTDPTYENRKQLWVAAIDSNPQPGVDPSHPAFWLPGQDFTTINMSGYWALEACHATGGSCTQGFECCTGYCDAATDGGGACSSGPVSGGCSQIGDACASTANCCNSGDVTCVGGYCAQMFR